MGNRISLQCQREGERDSLRDSNQLDPQLISWGIGQQVMKQDLYKSALHQGTEPSHRVPLQGCQESHVWTTKKMSAVENSRPRLEM